MVVLDGAGARTPILRALTSWTTAPEHNKHMEQYEVKKH